MSALPKIDDDGRIEVPRHIRDAAGLRIGDIVDIRVVGPGRLEVTTSELSGSENGARATMDEVHVPPSVASEETGEEVDWRTVEFPKMSIEELIAKYGAGEPIGDWNAFRKAAEAEQGDEIVRRIRAGLE